MMNRALVKMLKERPQACFMHDWWIALAASCFGTISYVKEPLYLYRQHGHNTLGAKATGSVKDVAERLERSAQVEENYERWAEGSASCVSGTSISVSDGKISKYHEKPIL